MVRHKRMKNKLNVIPSVVGLTRTTELGLVGLLKAGGLMRSSGMSVEAWPTIFHRYFFFKDNTQT